MSIDVELRADHQLVLFEQILIFPPILMGIDISDIFSFECWQESLSDEKNRAVVNQVESWGTSSSRRDK